MSSRAAVISILALFVFSGLGIAATWTHVGTSGFVVENPSQIRDYKRVVFCDMVKDTAGNIWAAVSYSSDGGASPEPRSSGVTIFKPNFASKIDVDLKALGYPGCVTKLVVGGDGAVYALQNYIHLEWSWEVTTSRILRLQLNPNNTVTVNMIYSPGEAVPWKSPPENRLGGMAVGDDGNIYWTQNGVSSYWKYHFFWRYDTAAGIVEEAPREPGTVECGKETHKMLDLEYVGDGKFAVVGPYYNWDWQCNLISWTQPCVNIAENHSNPTWGRKWNTANAYDPVRKVMWVGPRGERAESGYYYGYDFFNLNRNAGPNTTEIIDLGGGNYGIRITCSDGSQRGFETDWPGVPSGATTMAAKFRVDSYTGDQQIIYVYNNAQKAANGHRCMADIAILGGKFVLRDRGSTVLADLGNVVPGAWNEFYLTVDGDNDKCKLIWNGNTVYEGPITYTTGGGWVGWNFFGGNNIVATYDWLGVGAGYIAPGEMSTKYHRWLDGSYHPMTNFFLTNIMSRFDGSMDNPTIFDSSGKIAGTKVWHVNGYDEVNSFVPGKRNGGIYWVQALEVNPYTGEAWFAINAAPNYSYGPIDRVMTIPFSFTGTRPTLGDEGAPEPGSIVMNLMFDKDTDTMYALTCNPVTGVYNLYAAHIEAPGPLSIARAKDYRPGLIVQTDAPKVVTYAGDTFFYIEDADRTAGIKVMPSASSSIPSVGETVNVSGLLDVVDGEAVIRYAQVTPVGTGSVEPLGVTVKNVGGYAKGAQPATDPAAGLSNVGLLVRIAGRVEATPVDDLWSSAVGFRFWFTVDDGSGAVTKYWDLSGTQQTVPGIKVMFDPGLAGVSVGDFVEVTGVIGLDFSYKFDTGTGMKTYFVPGQRIIYPRTEADIFKYQSAN